MSETERPQIYLITPPVFELAAFGEQLKSVLDSHAIACLRLSLAARDEDALARAADALRPRLRGRGNSGRGRIGCGVAAYRRSGVGRDIFRRLQRVDLCAGGA